MLASEAQTELGYDLKDITDVPTATYLKWCDYLNKYAYRALSQQDVERWITTSSYTASNSPSTQALPADFRDIVPYGTGFFEINSAGEQTDVRLTGTSFGSTDKGFYITGTNVVFTGIESSTVYTLRYIPSISAITALSDSFVIPDEYNLNVLNALKTRYFVWDEDPSGESFSDARFVRSLNELMDMIRKEVQYFPLSNNATSF